MISSIEQRPYAARLASLLPWITAALFCVMLLSLHFRFLDFFIATTWHGRIGFDFFSVPRAFVNFIHGISIYNSDNPSFGPYATWYPYHPSLAFTMGSWLSLFPPGASYWAFVLFSSGILCLCAWLAARNASGPVMRRLPYFLLLCSPCVYLLLWNAQMHVFTVLAFSLILADLWNMRFNGAASSGIRPMLMTGLLVSLLSKPMVLPAIPVLFALKEARRTLWWTFGVYAVISAAFVFVPFLNVQGVGFDRIVDIVINPSHLMEEHVYSNLLVRAYRKDIILDNAIHWLNMRNLMAVIRADNFEFVSLSGFLADITGGKIPVALFKLPGFLLLGLSAGVFFVRNNSSKIMLALLTVVLSVCAFYVTYDAVYEYHISTVLCTIPFMLILFERPESAEFRGPLIWYCASAALYYIPTSYFWVRNPAFGHNMSSMAALPIVSIPVILGGGIYSWSLPMLRFIRVIPAAVMFGSLAWLVFRLEWTEIRCQIRKRQ